LLVWLGVFEGVFVGVVTRLTSILCAAVSQLVTTIMAVHVDCGSLFAYAGVFAGSHVDSL
jgi:hypothetical protein